MGLLFWWDEIVEMYEWQKSKTSILQEVCFGIANYSMLSFPATGVQNGVQFKSCVAKLAHFFTLSMFEMIPCCDISSIVRFLLTVFVLM